MKFVFSLYPLVADANRPGFFHVPQLVRFAKDVVQAHASALEAVPSGSRIWCWFEVPEDACTFCGGPFHPATGHWESLRRHWCGPCTRDFVVFIRDHSKRRWGGERFYDHALVPVGDTSAADLGADHK